jgi:hypothetical protein
MDRVSAAMATGKLEALGRSEIEALVLRWWGEWEPMRAPVLGEHDPPEEILEAIERDAANLNRPRLHDPDVVKAAVDQLLVRAGMVAAPAQYGGNPDRRAVPGSGSLHGSVSAPF